MMDLYVLVQWPQLIPEDCASAEPPDPHTTSKVRKQFLTKLTASQFCWEMDMVKRLEKYSAVAAELSSKRLISWTKLLSFEDKLATFRKTPKEVCQEFDILEMRLKEEKLMTDKAKDRIAACKVMLESLDSSFPKSKEEDVESWFLSPQTCSTFASLSKELAKILSEIQTLDISELLWLNSLNDSASEQIEGKEIALLLGGTGAGKSTTTHYLAGSKMEEVRLGGEGGGVNVGKRRHIQPVPSSIKNPMLFRVKSGANAAASETRYITALELDPTHIGLRRTTPAIILCDTPGFFDSKSPIVDICNILGIIRAVKRTRSVKIIFLNPQNFCANKFSVLKDYVRVLVGMIPTLDEFLNSIIFCYSHFNKEQQAELRAYLKNVLENLTDDDMLDKAFVAVLEKMERSEHIFVEPLSGLEGAQRLYQKIVDIPAIMDPYEAFQFSISKSSKFLVESQLQRDRAGVVNALTRSDVQFAAFKLDEMKAVCNLLEIPELTRIYEDCLKILSTHVNNLRSSSLASVTKCLTDRNDLTAKDIHEFCQAIEQVRLFEPLGSAFLKQEGYPTAIGMTTEFLDRVRSLFPYDDSEIWTSQPEISCLRLDKASTVAKCYTTDSISSIQIYKDTARLLRECLEIKLDAFMVSVDGLDFESATKHLDLFKRMMLLASAHLDDFNAYQSGLSYLKNRLKNWKEAATKEVVELKKKCQPDSSSSIAEEVPEAIQHFSKAVSSTKKHLLLQVHLGTELVTELQNSFADSMQQVFQQLKATMETLWAKDKAGSLPQMRRYLKLMASLRSIECIDGSSMEIYMSVLQHLLHCISELKNVAETSLEKLKKKEKLKPEEMEELIISMTALRDSTWIDEFQQGRKDLFQRVEKLLSSIARNSIVEIEGLEINLSGFKHPTRSVDTSDEQSLPGVRAVETACSLFEQLHSMKELEQSFEWLKKENEKVENNFVHSMKCVIHQIFDLSNGEATGDDFSDKLESVKLEADAFLLSKGYTVALLLSEIRHVGNQIADQEESSSPAAADLLVELRTKISSLNELYKEYQTKSRPDTSMRKSPPKSKASSQGQSQTPIELTLDPFLVNASFIFLEYTQNSLPKSIKEAKVSEPGTDARLIDLCGSAQSALKAYVQLYLKQLCKGIDQKYADALNRTNTFTYLDRSFSIKGVISDLNTLQQLHDTWPRIIDCAANTNTLNNVVPEWKQKLKELLPKEFEVDLHTAHTTNNKELFSILLDTAKALRDVDKFLDSDHFSTLWLEYSQKLNNVGLDAFQKALEYVKDLDWDAFITIQNSVDSEQHVQQIRGSLSRSTVTFIEKLRQTAHLLSADLDVEKVKNIVSDLGKLVDAKNNIYDKFLDNNAKEELDGIKKDISEIVRGKIQKYLRSIESLIKSNLYIEAEEKLEHLQNITNCVSTLNISSESFNVAENVSAMSEDLKKQYDEILQEYKTLGLDSFYLKPPKDILDRLGKVSPPHQVLLSQILQDRIMTEVQSLTNSSERTKLALMRTRNALNYLPENLRLRMEGVLQQQNELIKERQDIYNSTLTKAVESDDIDTIKDKWEELERAVPISHTTAHSIKTSVQNRIKEKRVSIEKHFQHRDRLSVALAEVKSFEEWLVFSKRVPEISMAFVTFKQQTKELFDRCCTTIRRGLLPIGVENVESIVEAEIEVLHVFIDSYDPACQVFYPSMKDEIESVCVEVHDFFENLDGDIFGALKASDASKLVRALADKKRWSKCLSLLNQKVILSKNINLTPLDLYPTTCNKVLAQIGDLLESFEKIELLCEDTKHDERSRNRFYSTVSANFSFFGRLSSLEHLFTGIPSSTFDFVAKEKSVVAAFEKKVEQLAQSAQRLVLKPSYNALDLITLNHCYSNLKAISKKVASTTCKKSFEQADKAFLAKIEQLRPKNDQEKRTVEVVKTALVKLKEISTHVFVYQSFLKAESEDILLVYKNTSQNRAFAVNALHQALIADDSGFGPRVLKDHAMFAGALLQLRNVKVNAISTETVRDALKGTDDLDTEKLYRKYQAFLLAYKEQLKVYLVSERMKVNPSGLISTILKITHTLRQTVLSTFDKDKKITWNRSVVDQIPNLVACIFALWTVNNSQHYYEHYETSQQFDELLLMKPHVAQVFSIFRLLGVGDKNEVLVNNLGQIKTGEGKSLTLGVLSSVMALLGIEVSCVCYSDYLSQRDYNSFFTIFQQLAILDKVHYGTFNKMCERLINERGDIRKLLEDIIKGNPINNRLTDKDHPKILLIDEVDVFFSKDFYGEAYTPGLRLQDPTIKDLTDAIWQLSSKVSLTGVVSSPQFQACVNRLPQWNNLLTEAVKNMIADLKDYKHDYLVKDDRIQYKDADSYTPNIIKRYKTLWAYYHENSKNRITPESLEANVAVIIQCGHYSFAEMPYQFNYIMGVSGTLETLSPPEEEVVQEQYHLMKRTFLPSMYGSTSTLKWSERSPDYVIIRDTHVCRFFFGNPLPLFSSSL
jgi:hypothetical protein